MYRVDETYKQQKTFQYALSTTNILHFKVVVK